MTTLAVLQPGYLPWLGFFDQLLRADVFVLYDDVPFDKHGWRNRNRIKSPNGPQWLTVPVLHKGLGQPAICQVAIDNSQPWQRKQMATLSQLYARAPFLAHYLPQLGEILNQPWSHLAPLNRAMLDQLAAWLDIHTPIFNASQLGVGGGKSERLINLCHHFGANRYLTGDAARDYLDVALFAHHGIHIVWQNYHHPVYPQQHGPFLSHLSVVDLLFNMGEASGLLLRQ